jgi:hypothetical protein
MEEGGPAVHAVIVTVRIDAGLEDRARAALRDRVVPGVSQAPGFITGTWVELPSGEGMSLVVFDSEANARNAAPAVGMRPQDDPVTVTAVTHCAVLAHA